MQNMCGVDISKNWLDSFIAPDHFERFENNEEGIVRLAAFVRDHDAHLVVMESSGGIERVPFYQLWADGIGCAIVNPRSVRDFAKAKFCLRIGAIWKKPTVLMPRLSRILRPPKQ